MTLTMCYALPFHRIRKMMWSCCCVDERGDHGAFSQDEASE